MWAVYGPMTKVNIHLFPKTKRCQAKWHRCVIPAPGRQRARDPIRAHRVSLSLKKNGKGVPLDGHTQLRSRNGLSTRQNREEKEIQRE